MFIAKFIDTYLTKIEASYLGIEKAKKEKDIFGRIQSTFELSMGLATATKYSGTLAQRAIAIIPEGINSTTLQFLRNLPITGILSGIGTVTSLLGLLIEAFSLRRQAEMLTYFPATIPSSCKTEEDKQQLIKALEKLKKVNMNHFIRALPEFLQHKLKEHPHKHDLFDYWINEVKLGRTSTPHRNLLELRAGIYRKEVVHMVNLISSLYALVGLVALALVCPPAALVVATAAGVALLALSYVLNKGWAENPHDGIDGRLCFPQFMHKPLKVDPDDEREMVEIRREKVTEIQEPKPPRSQLVVAFYYFRALQGRFQSWKKGHD